MNGDHTTCGPPESGGGSPTDTATDSRTRFEADRESSDIPDSLSAVMKDPRSDMFASGEADQSSLVPVFERRSFVDDVCFGGESFDSCLETLDRLLSRFEKCRIASALPKACFRFNQDFAVYGAALYQVREEVFGPGGDLSTAKPSFTALRAKVADAPILRHFDIAKEVHVILFANDWALNTTLMQEHDGVMHPVRFCGRVLKDNEVNYHPAAAFTTKDVLHSVGRAYDQSLYQVFDIGVG
ncbi:unnamed protein product [Phytophthora fragariaefolia]|uniref:Unnamed protein product n=1 Tax=Phytophthora fragariaefolia TaxID=1490495 RepID=A0A9W6TT76_9STRA|nr:unnamed protein product [Phytophthora fragariaefolia]